MKNIIQIAVRNLFRYRRRTYLTAAIIMFGVSMVIVFSGFANTFKKNMIGAITDGLLGDMQIHANGFVASIDNLPLYLTIGESNYQYLKDVMDNNPEISAYTPRIKFGGMISTYVKTSGIRISAVDPLTEMKVCRDLVSRVTPEPDPEKGLLKKGEIIVPSVIANGLSIKIGDEIVVLANNKEGSINAVTLKTAGFSGTVTDPSGRDAYITIEDAMALLRMDKLEINEVAVKLKNFNNLNKAYKKLSKDLSETKDQNGKPVFEVHTWQDLSPITTFLKIVDLLLVISKVILIVIVLISIMNVMIMSVYERVSEIGTIAAIGTVPSKILSMFLYEGVSMGVLGVILGISLGLIVNTAVGLIKPTVMMGHMMKVVLEPFISAGDVIAACLIVIVMAGLASLEPAVKASKMEVVDAMRHN